MKNSKNNNEVPDQLLKVMPLVDAIIREAHLAGAIQLHYGCKISFAGGTLRLYRTPSQTHKEDSEPSKQIYMYEKEGDTLEINVSSNAKGKVSLDKVFLNGTLLDTNIGLQVQFRNSFQRIHDAIGAQYQRLSDGLSLELDERPEANFGPAAALINNKSDARKALSRLFKIS